MTKNERIESVLSASAAVDLRLQEFKEQVEKMAHLIDDEGWRLIGEMLKAVSEEQSESFRLIRKVSE